MNIRMGLAFAICFTVISGCAAKNPQTRQAVATPPTNFDKAKDPEVQPRTHFAAAELAESQGHLEQAAQQYRAALKQDPKFAEAMFRLGIVYTQLQEFPQAIEIWNKYVKATNGSATAYSNLGFCEEVAGDPAAAEAAYRKGIARDPMNEACHVNFGLMLARHGRPNEGLLQLQTVLPPGKAHYDLAAVYESLHRFEEAKAEYGKALISDPTLNDAKSKLATLPQN
jgi:tetratricopeptide (TPR) repeat protein